jgi:hypothetical protein
MDENFFDICTMPQLARSLDDKTSRRELEALQHELRDQIAATKRELELVIQASNEKRGVRNEFQHHLLS